MKTINKIINAYNIDNIKETYPEEIGITDLKNTLGTKGHIFVIRGDKAYEAQLKGRENLANPKFWLYENLINSARVQEQLKKHPNHKLFDGVGYSSLEALGFHASRLGRKAVVVMAHEMIPDQEVFSRYNIEVIHADGVMEDGYVKKQKEILSKRDDLIPFHQALYGAQCLAPIGNRIASQLEELCIKIDATFWCMASGSNLYGIGEKIKQKFPESKTFVAEPETNLTIDPLIDMSDIEQVKNFAKDKLKKYSLNDWDKRYHGVFPLHVSGANRYLLFLWANTGKFGFDEAINVPNEKIVQTQKDLVEINSDYNWTKTTALTLVPAIKLAEQGKNVVVMSYGKNREHKSRRLIINNLEDLIEIPWLFRGETITQKVALTAAVLTGEIIALLGTIYSDPKAPMYMIN